MLFAVCDARYRFTYFKIGSPGRVNDGFIFRHSKLKHILDVKSEQLARLGSVINNVEIPLHIIADSAFPLLNQLINPMFQFYRRPRNNSILDLVVLDVSSKMHSVGLN